jgi:hypothetical protein
MLAMDQNPDSNFTAKYCELNIIKDYIKRSYTYGGEKLGDVNISPKLIILYLALGFFLDQVLLIQLLVLFYRMPLQLSS